MKTKSVAMLSVVAVMVAGVASSAYGGSGRTTVLEALLTLRPGVSRSAHHPVEDGVYGSFDATFNSARSTVAYSLYYQGLNGSAFRVLIRSRATGRTLAVLCDSCHPLPAGRSHAGLPVSHLGGVVRVDPDAGFLTSSGRAFVEIDSTGYPSGEIGGQISVVPPLAPGETRETPRCC